MISIRNALIGTALVGSTMLGGGLGAALLNNPVSAATDSTSTTVAGAPPSGNAPPGRPPDPHIGGHVGTNGTKEVLLTGDTAVKVQNAALAAVADGTIERVETDAEGATYEAHMVKADGTPVTVKVGSDFKVTSVDTDAQRGR